MTHIEDAPPLISEGTYTAFVQGFGKIKQTKSGSSFYMRVKLNVPGYTLSYFLFGNLDTLILLDDNQDHFRNQKWRIKVKHIQHDGGTYYTAQRIKS